MNFKYILVSHGENVDRETGIIGYLHFMTSPLLGVLDSGLCFEFFDDEDAILENHGWGFMRGVSVAQLDMLLAREMAGDDDVV